MPTGFVRLDRDDVRGRIDFVCRLQAFLDVAFDQPVPACPTHNLGLAPTRAGDDVIWSCPKGDLRCEVGAYELAAFWPPTRADSWAAPLLAKRFRQSGVSGLSGFSVDDRDGQLVARIEVRPDADDDAVRSAASPLLVEFTRVPAISTVRKWCPPTEREPAHETLTLTGVAMRLARLDGTLRRAAPEDDCDFLVGDTRVRLAAAHVIGEPGRPVLMDEDWVRFADQGDQVSCGGGGGPAGPVRTDRPSVFHAGQISVYRDEPATKPRKVPTVPLNTER